MKNQRLHLSFWRWHFYAAICITPLLITLSLSGIASLPTTFIIDPSGNIARVITGISEMDLLLNWIDEAK